MIQDAITFKLSCLLTFVTFLSILFFAGLIDPYYEPESRVVGAKWKLTLNSGIVVFSMFLFLMLIVGFLFYIKFKLDTQDPIYMILGRISLLDNAPYYLFGCAIQKRYLVLVKKHALKK